MYIPYFTSSDKLFYLLHGDTMEILPKIDKKFDMVFADPPYFLSNDGLTIKNGQIVSVNKGRWDKSQGIEFVNEFNRKWLSQIRENMKDDATIWISGTMHNIFSIGQILVELGFKILNIITWEKTNPPPNFSCRYFTHSTEQIIWARKEPKIPHYFDYSLMKLLNDNKQMKDVWKLPAIAPWEKSCGKHPTQKPLSLLTRIILASTKPDAWILDPFTGSSTTGIAANIVKRKFLGIDQEESFLKISIKRKEEIYSAEIIHKYKKKIAGFINTQQLSTIIHNEIDDSVIKIGLGYCRKKDINSLLIKKTFYFHAIENNKKILDFPTELLNVKYLYTYSRNKNFLTTLTGHSAPIESIKLKHKTEIEGKESSSTEYYYEVILKREFEFNKDLIFKLNRETLFEKFDDENKMLFTKFLPSVTTMQKLMNSKIE